MPFVLDNVQVTYGDRQALMIEHLTIRPDATTAVMGPNGAGKTTLLKVLAGLLEPARGRVTYRGEPVDSHTVGRLRRNVSLVHQMPVLFDTTVFANVAFGLKARRVPKAAIEAAVTESLNLVGCSDLKKRRARELSGGEITRVAIARTLALHPDVLLLDEPFANVDQPTAKTLEEALGAIKERGRTLIFSTHNPRLAHRLAHDVIILTDGHLSPSPYENLFAGKPVAEGSLAWFDTGRIRISVPPGLPHTGHISIGPDEILLSRQPLASSARNVFQGRLTRIEERGEGVLDVGVEAGESFIVRLTHQSLRELGLTIGEQVYITFKSTSVKSL